MNTGIQRLIAVTGIVGLALLGGCAPKPGTLAPRDVPPANASVRGEVRVFVTDDLRGAFDEATASLVKDLPNVTLKVESGPLPTLRGRILQGDRPDLLVSLGPDDLIPLVEQGLIADGGALARVRLTLAEPASRPVGLTSLPDLARKEVRTVAVASAKNSALGVATQAALKKALLLKQVQPKLKEVAPEKLLDTVASGAADVAIVPLHWLHQGEGRGGKGREGDRGEQGSKGAGEQGSGGETEPTTHHSPLTTHSGPETSGTSGTLGTSEVERAVDVPDNLYGDFRVGVSLIADGPNPEAARAVLGYLTGAAAKKVFVAWGCAPLEGDVAVAGQSLLVHCGAGLRRPMDEIGEKFKEKYGVDVRYNYTGSPCLLAQIILYKKGDLYMPGEDYYMQQAVQRNFVEEHKVVAYFVPVIMVRKGNPHGVKGLADLLQPDLKVGLGDPKSCAVGSVSKKVLEKNGLWEKLEQSGNLKFLSSTAPELGNHIKFGTIDAALNWDAVASWYEDKADVIPIPAQQNLTSACPLGVLKLPKSQQQDLSRKFLEFVAVEGQSIFQKHHYTVDPAKPSYSVAGAEVG